MSRLTYTTRIPEETQELGRRLGALLEVGDLVLLQGSLGSGKTTLTQGIAWGAGVTGYAHSPTFVLVNEYAGRITIYHVDLYRFDGGATAVDDLREVEELDFDGMLATGACVVEWADRATEALSPAHIAVSLEPGRGPDERTIALEAVGERYVVLLGDFARGGTRAASSAPHPTGP